MTETTKQGNSADTAASETEGKAMSKKDVARFITNRIKAAKAKRAAKRPKPRIK